MRIVRLVVTIALLSTVACFAQNSEQQANKTLTTTKTQINAQAKRTAAKPEKPPKKEKNSKQTGTKLHPQQEQAYAMSYKTGAVRP